MIVKSLRNTLIISLSLILSLSLSTTRTAQAAGPSCDQVLESCDAALKAKQRELDLADLGVKLRSDEIERLGKENLDLRNRDNSFFTNPFLWATIGLFVGSRVVR